MFCRKRRPPMQIHFRNALCKMVLRCPALQYIQPKEFIKTLAGHTGWMLSIFEVYNSHQLNGYREYLIYIRDINGKGLLHDILEINVKVNYHYILRYRGFQSVMHKRNNTLFWYDMLS